ncbi:MAG: A24 family peptidase [Oscillospiraceae bacterium]|jgi:leader peptidase (prepilin peptidase)/N-methyltransferase|nr:A24 family peptidase [Oscillospiraceae bacterium]
MAILLVAAFLAGIVGAGLMARDAREPQRRAEVSARGLVACCAFVTAACVGTALVLALAYPGNTFFFNMRRICLISLLLPAAFIDYKSYRIPNAFIFAGIGYWVALFAAEPLVAGAGGVTRAAAANLTAAGALTAASLLCAAAMRGSIGPGDIKMFAVMGLLLSAEGAWCAVLLSLAAAFAVSVYLLATKKKTRKDTLPFAPALAAGTLLSVLLTGT